MTDGTKRFFNTAVGLSRIVAVDLFPGGTNRPIRKTSSIIVLEMYLYHPGMN